MEGDFKASLDLMDVYFQILVHTDSREFSPLRLGKSGLPVQSSVFCSIDYSLDLHQNVAPVSTWAHSV